MFAESRLCLRRGLLTVCMVSVSLESSTNHTVLVLSVLDFVSSIVPADVPTIDLLDSAADKLISVSYLDPVL